MSVLRASWLQLDRILRGEATKPSALRRGTIEVSASGLTWTVLILGVSSGVCMGSFAVFRSGLPGLWPLMGAALKVPALFVLTLAVTFPSLYVFNALVGSALSLRSTLRILIAALAVMTTMLASLGPIVAFFAASTTSYPFMVLLNVAVFALSGFLGLSFLLQTLHRLSLPPVETGTFETVESVGDEKGHTDPRPRPEATGPLDRLDDRLLGRHVKLVFRFWLIVFGLVGAQMGWVLRPFIGDPNRPFVWLRGRESNFFEAVWHTFLSLFS